MSSPFVVLTSVLVSRMFEVNKFFLLLGDGSTREEPRRLLTLARRTSAGQLGALPAFGDADLRQAAS